MSLLSMNLQYIQLATDIFEIVSGFRPDSTEIETFRYYLKMLVKRTLFGKKH